MLLSENVLNSLSSRSTEDVMFVLTCRAGTESCLRREVAIFRVLLGCQKDLFYLPRSFALSIVRVLFSAVS